MSPEEEIVELNGVLSRLFATAARAKILDFFLDHKEFDYPVSEIATKAGLSFRTVLRELPRIEATGIILKSRKVSKATMYRLDVNLPAVSLLDKLSLELSRMPAFDDIGQKVHHVDAIDEVMKEHAQDESGMFSQLTERPDE